MFRLYHRNGKITAISASERDEPHIMISDVGAAEFINGIRNPDDWHVVGAGLERRGKTQRRVPQRVNKLVMFSRSAEPWGLIATVNRSAGLLTLDLVGDAEWPEPQIMMWVTHDDDPSLFRATLSYELPELIERRRLEFKVPTDLPASIGICGYPICDDMLLVDVAPTTTTPI